MRGMARWAVLAFGLLPALLAAQVFDLGLKGGIGLDDLRTDLPHEAVLGGHGGLFVRYKPDHFGVQAEFQVNSLGSRVTVERERLELRSISMHLPVLLLLAHGPWELHSGFYFEKYLTMELATEFDVDVSDLPVDAGRLSGSGLGALVGAGVRSGHFYAGLRYNMGLQDIGTGPYLTDVRTRQWQAYLGFGFFAPPKAER
jgi:hypothetical protein